MTKSVSALRIAFPLLILTSAYALVEAHRRKSLLFLGAEGRSPLPPMAAAGTQRLPPYLLDRFFHKFVAGKRNGRNEWTKRSQKPKRKLWAQTREQVARHSSDESEGTLMAKRETNAKRTAREYERRTTLQMADHVAEWIRARRKIKEDLAPDGLESWTAKEMKETGRLTVEESKRWRKTYTFLGQVFCEFDENPHKFLRLVADRLEGKRPYSPGDDWNDGAITVAYKEACSHMPRPRVRPNGEVIITLPSFSEFQNVFSEQSQLSRPPSARSLRRSLKRMGYRTRPDKRGRPQEK